MARGDAAGSWEVYDLLAQQKEEEEASRQRAIKQGDNGPKNNPEMTPTNGTGGGRVETAREESKREEADRVVQYVAD